MRVSPTLTFSERVAAIAARIANPPKPEPPRADHPVVKALAKAGRPLTNKELAEALGVSQGYASKLRRQAGDRVVSYRRGTRVYAALAGWRLQ